MSVVSHAQKAKPVLKFLYDSILIGEPTPVSFSYQHKPSEKVVFPDSTFDFSPLEYDHRDVFTTNTDSMSTDSAIYWLSTFEIDLIQTLKLPVFIYNKKDSIPYYSNEDTIYLTEMIPVVSDTLKIKENTTIQEVDSEFNYPIYSIVFGVLALIALIFGFLFKGKIGLYFKMKKLIRNHEKFINEFDTKLSGFESSNNKDDLESLTIIWKSYLEKLLQIPLTKLSTKEIQSLIENVEVIEILKETDGMLFGGIELKNSDLDTLKTFAIDKYTDITLSLKDA